MQETDSLYGLIRKRQSSTNWNDYVTECEAFRGCSEWSFLIFKWFLQILKMPNPRVCSAKKGVFWTRMFQENTPHMGVCAHKHKTLNIFCHAKLNLQTRQLMFYSLMQSFYTCAQQLIIYCILKSHIQVFQKYPLSTTISAFVHMKVRQCPNLYSQKRDNLVLQLLYIKVKSLGYDDYGNSEARPPPPY